jgi:replicative DNA helicase
MSRPRDRREQNFYFTEQQASEVWKRIDPEQMGLPSAIEAEQSILGAMLISEGSVEAILSELGNPAMAQSPFYQERHAVIYKAAAHLASRGEPCDLITLTNLLRTHGKLDEVGGPPYLVELTTRVVTTVNVRTYCKIVLERRLARDLMLHMSITNAKLLASEDVFETQAGLEATLDELRTGVRLDRKQPVILGPALSSTLAESSAAAGNTGMPGIPIGIRGVDEVLGGLMPGDLSIVAAPPSGGKTALGITIAKNIALYPIVEKRTGVGFFSLEMNMKKVTLRLLSAEAQVSSDRIRRNALTDHEYASLQAAVGRLQPAKIYIQDSVPITALDIRAQARQLKRLGCGIILVDYLQIVAPVEAGETREREVAAITQQLKDTAKMLDIHIMAMAQYNRTGAREKRKPIMSDLRESGAIEQIADVILFIHHPNDPTTEYENGEPIELIVGKNRDGPRKDINVKFFPYYSLFEDGAKYTPSIAGTTTAPPPSARNYYESEHAEVDEYAIGNPAF